MNFLSRSSTVIILLERTILLVLQNIASNVTQNALLGISFPTQGVSF